tara:strand:+ start:26487 stop:27953 length:1467 start_codon:yes stop_codon:yes gene_type:complete
MMILYHLTQVDIINMSQSGIQYAMQESFGGSERLLIHYEFSGMSGRHLGNRQISTLNFSVIENSEPSKDTGLYSGIFIAFGSTPASSKKFATGTILKEDSANLTGSNIKVTGTSNLPYSNQSVIIDFDFNTNVENCVLFGSLEKTSTSINGNVITGAKGYNFGVTDRGKLFYQGFNQQGDFIYTSSSLELSKRNLVSFSIGSNQLSMCRYDYLNNKIQKDEFFVDTSAISSNTGFYLGGSPIERPSNNGTLEVDQAQYFKSGASNVSLNSFALVSGYASPSAMFALGSGMIGDYSESSTSEQTEKRITGYSQTTVYQTGITGYRYEITGDIDFATGRDMLTGNFFNSSSVNTGEGDRYFIYRSFDNNLSASGIKTFVKEEVGYLKPDGTLQYLPTGDDAFATLGLRDVDGAVQEFSEHRGISGSESIAVKLFGSKMQVGALSRVSGVLQEPLYETIVNTPAISSSGIVLGVNSEKFKKDYIYYLGGRP